MARPGRLTGSARVAVAPRRLDSAPSRPRGATVRPTRALPAGGRLDFNSPTVTVGLGHSGWHCHRRDAPSHRVAKLSSLLQVMIVRLRVAAAQPRQAFRAALAVTVTVQVPRCRPARGAGPQEFTSTFDFRLQLSIMTAKLSGPGRPGAARRRCDATAGPAKSTHGRS